MIEVTLKCDRCLAAYPAGQDAEALRALAHGDGWSCTPRGRPARDYCPSCRKAMMAARGPSDDPSSGGAEKSGGW